MRLKSALALFLTCLPLAPLAQPVDDLARLTVLPGWREPDGSHIAAVRIDLAEGWKTYWRAPGDTGIPPSFSFAGDLVSGVQPHFPTPRIYDTAGLRTIGYAGSVVFPLRLAVPAGQVTVTGQVEIGVCDEICIPMTFDITMLLPAAGQADEAIIAALQDRPLTGSEANVGAVRCTVSPISDGLQVVASITLAEADTTPVVVIETADRQIWVSEPQITRTGPTVTATVDMVHLSRQPFALDRSGLRITLLGDDRAIDIIGCAGD